ncbi:MAG TPA: DUF542 domain-containing protein [Chitinophagaceae bacterium]|jgi:regulator of cell morphogenesis and NO signaling|nr:DUF542 domain-containing protein [Chitinophagaceae bacterium]
MVTASTKRIDENLSVSNIVTADYRTADVFRKYGIEICCGGKLPLKTVCGLKELNLDSIKKDLLESTRNICLPNSLKSEEWGVDFLTDYIVNIHHEYLKKTLPETKDTLLRFVESHQDRFTYLPNLLKIFNELSNYTLPHLQEEEDIIFPYIRQISHAYNSKESYAALLVRTLRKPVENVMNHENESLTALLQQMRQLTDDYIPPERACTSHRVVFSKLLEIDNDLVQHLYLENNILFPKAIAMEKELLERND